MVYVLWFFCFSWYYVKSWTNAATLLLQTLKKPWYCGQSHGCGPFYKTLLFMLMLSSSVSPFFFLVSYLLFGCYLKICGHLNAEHVAYFLWTVCHLALHWECIYIFFNDSLHQERLQNPNQDVVCFTPNELLYCIPSF